MQGEDRLLELQEADSAADRLRARRDELESGSEVRTMREVADRAESRVGELRLAIDVVAREQSQLERDIDSLQQRGAAEQRRMYDGSIVNEKELAAIQHEIANLSARRSRFEEDLLERMERLETLEADVGVAEGQARTARERFEAAGGAAARELASIEGRLVQRQAERGRMAAGIEPELLELYEELRRSKRGVAVAALADGVCQGCHQILSSVELNRLKHVDGVKRCEHCRRILVLP